MISQEEQLRIYLMGALKKEQTLTALQLKLSQLNENEPDEALSEKIAEEFQNILEIFGQTFCLKNGDVFLIYSPRADERTVKAALIRTWLNLSNVSRSTKAGSALEKWYRLPEETENLLHEVSRIDNKQIETVPEKKEHQKFVAPLIYDKNEKLFTPEMLARVSKALLNTDISNMMRRQSVCIVLDGAAPQPLFEEVFVSIADLGESILPGVSLTATPWLFQDLTETLDKRVLSCVSRHDDGAFRRAFSLNLNISTILSEEFHDFDENIQSKMKNTIVLELQPIDIFSDLHSYLMARDFAQNLGYRVCIDGVTLNTLKFIDRERLGADYIKLNWSPDLFSSVQENPELGESILNIGQNKTILCRVDNEDALKIAKDYNITLLQGRYVQHLLTKNRLRPIPSYRY